MKPYNGHKNWNYWNVSLWINNDEGLYSLARDHVRRLKNKDAAARAFIADLASTHTPDGARYTISAVRAAIAEM